MRRNLQSGPAGGNWRPSRWQNSSGEPGTALHVGVREAKKKLIEQAIEQANGNYTEAAGILGVHPNHLFRLIRTLNLTPKCQRRA